MNKRCPLCNAEMKPLKPYLSSDYTASATCNTTPPSSGLWHEMLNSVSGEEYYWKCSNPKCGNWMEG